MYCYKLYNHAAMNSLQGSMLAFYAHDHYQAKELGESYAEKLGWTAYSVVAEYDYDRELTVYECKGE